MKYLNSNMQYETTYIETCSISYREFAEIKQNYAALPSESPVLFTEFKNFTFM